MGMTIDKSRRQHKIVGIDRGIGLPVVAVAEIDDAITIDRNVDKTRRAAAAIDDARSTDQQITTGHCKEPRLSQPAAAWVS